MAKPEQSRIWRTGRDYTKSGPDKVVQPPKMWGETPENFPLRAGQTATNQREIGEKTRDKI